MTDISWLAALLSPRSVSPHPNFRSVDRVTPAGLLGLVTSGEDRDRDELAGRLERPLTSAETDLIEAASQSIQTRTMQSGVAELIRLSTNPGVSDAAMRVAAALFAASALSEMDEPGRAVELLDKVVRLLPDDTDDGRLLAGAVMQQQAMRACESGVPFQGARDRARYLLDTVDIVQVSRYPTSQGSRWPAATTNRNLLKALLEANQDLYDSALGFPDTKTLKRLLRTSNSPLVSAMIRHAGTGKREYIKEAFSAYALSSERSVRSQDPVDHPVWRSLMFFELVGHRRLARAYRQVLGELRMLRSQGQTELSREGLRLLRQADDAKRLRLALGLVRGGGPLAALTQEAETIVTHRLSSVLLREVELATLEASAQLLDTASADAAFTAVLGSLQDVPIETPFRRELAAIQVENRFRAAAALAPVAKRVNDLAMRVLDGIESTGPTGDELLVRAHARGVAPLDWEEVDESVKARWRMWLAGREREPSTTAGWETLLNMVTPELRNDEVSAAAASGTPTLDRVANELNVIMTSPEVSEQTTAWLRESASDLITERLDAARRDAAKGSFTMYSIEPADLAIALIQHAQADLWEPVTEYLLDPRLPRRMKTEALNRISSAPESVPDFVRRTFASRGTALFAADAVSSPFEPPEIDPYPAAVRVLAALGLSTIDDLLSALSTLAAGPVRSKLEAARTLSTIVATTLPTPEWAVSIALQLSSDANANVRAETGRTLAVVLKNTHFARALIESRLLGLLDEDGMLVPLLVLRGLTGDAEISPGVVRDRVSQMAQEHPVFGVRVQARYVLGDLQ